ncbi:retroviral-like aspartic protease family protein [Sphingomonas sp. URHD0057]|uniref:retroviral-like aspartic protease family protein n=1 Tax=Sphingomonas sp. URHD0057 TaxID=1380389 RepID=UPI00048A4413|nr:retroviral-like aspartic protease family protein [Sphingomonas sp. URHD0057]
MARLTIIALSLGCALFASSPAAAAPVALVLTGTTTEGGVPNHFAETIDLATGHSKRTQQMGGSQSQSGFDGQLWEQSNGIVTVSNLPSATARSATSAWVGRQGWRERRMPRAGSARRIVPPGGNPVALDFDTATGLPRTATIDGDWGPIVVTFTDWRKVGPFTYPFRREEVSSVGEHTIVQLETAKLVDSLPKAGLSRPSWKSHAESLPPGGTAIPFAAIGAKKSHILVESRINGRPATLVFDTGAANYLTTEAAPAFGIEVTGGVNLSGVGEASSAGGYATVDRIALGAAVLRNETLVVGPSPFPPSNGTSATAAGFTGFEFFAEYVTTIDYPAQKIRFASTLPKAAKGLRVPFYNDGSHIYVRAKIDGVDGMFGLDTGDGGTVIIFPAFAARFAIHGAAGNAATSGGGVGGSVKAQPGVLDRFSMGGLNFDRLPVRFSQNKGGAFASKSLAGNLGGGILQCFRITIDFPAHLLVLDPVPDSPRCAPGGKVSRA